MEQTSSSWNPNSAGAAAARECAAIARDLERLYALISDGGDRLLTSFNMISAAAPRLAGDPRVQAQMNAAVGNAVTALQFQDMSSQLIQHAKSRLAVLGECLAKLDAEADPLLASTRMQPVRQTGLGAGSIDLF